MKTKLIFILPFVALTACSTYKDPVHNPQSLNNDDLIKTQIAKIEAMQRDMDKREQELKMQHLKELHQTQLQNKSSTAQTVNTNCRFLCF
jgi:hypothetical protein